MLFTFKVNKMALELENERSHVQKLLTEEYDLQIQ